METINTQLAELLQQMGVQPADMGWSVRIVIIVGILIIACLADWLCRRLVIPSVQKLTAKTKFTWDDYLFNDAVLNDICHLLPPIILYVLLPFAFINAPVTLAFLLKLCNIYIIICGTKLVCSFLTSLYTISSEHEKLKNHPLKGVYQMIKLLAICVSIILIVSELLDNNPMNILTGLGASAAILMLVFKDTIVGLVAGVQLSANDMLRPGDWISVPKHNADGMVEEVTLTTVKVRNWDKTVTTLPPYALVSDSFQNWQSMFDIGRRVKRSINIDMNTVRFCTDEELAAYKAQPWMEGFEATGSEEVNLHVFRHYVEYYLMHHAKVNQDLMILVRQLQPTQYGMPIELYFFSANTAWVRYEKLQAEVFDHVLAVLPRFGLKVFQSPAGTDFMGNINK